MIGPFPLWRRGFHARVRLRHVLSWGLVVLSVTCFVSLMTYLPITQRGIADTREAARAVLPAIIVIQAIVLMMMGTGAVAAGVARERDTRLLDYQRLTPMRPTSKILGYLVGLPMREYVLFALTVPLVAIAAWVGEFPVRTLLHFYAVFFTSVWVYHMTALVAGMVAPKPRTASMLSVGMVVILYFVLPNLSRLGITFFEFLTIRPTFFGLIQQELPEALRPRLEASGIDAFRDVPFFATTLHPTVYTLLVQGFVLATSFSIVHRRWRDEASHLFSKIGAVLVLAGVAFFVAASDWAVMVQDAVYDQVFGMFDGRRPDDLGRRPESVLVLLMITAAITGLGYLVLVTLVTPSHHRALAGWRRARRAGRSALRPTEDAASSLPAALVMIGLVLTATGLVVERSIRASDVFDSPPDLLPLLLAAGTVVAVGLFVQGLRERFGLRVYAMALFVLWVLPTFAMMILLAAFEAQVLGTAVGLPCPPMLLYVAMGDALSTAVASGGETPIFLPPEVLPHARTMSIAGFVGYGVAAALAQGAAARQRRRRRLDGAGATADAALTR